MKLVGHLLLLLGALAVEPSIGQPVLTVGNSVPTSGESFVELVGAAMDPGDAGAGVVWDFTAFVAQDTFGFSYSSPLSDSIGGCPLMSPPDLMGGHLMVGQDPLSVRVEPWFGYPIGTLPVISELAITLIPPMAFGDVVPSTHLLRLMDNGCQSFPVHRADTSVADAYGALHLPWGTYGPVLRIRTTSEAFAPGAAPLMAYRYYLPGTHHPMVTIAQGFPVYLDTTWTMRVLDPASIVGFVDHQRSGGAFRIWPQPVQDILHVSGPPGPSAQVIWEVLDASGRRLRQWSAIEGQEGVDVSFLSNGLYVLRVLGPDGARLTSTFIKNHP